MQITVSPPARGNHPWKLKGNSVFPYTTPLVLYERGSRNSSQTTGYEGISLTLYDLTLGLGPIHYHQIMPSSRLYSSLLITILTIRIGFDQQNTMNQFVYIWVVWPAHNDGLTSKEISLLSLLYML
ncbi:hypothetical protein ElyMa_002665100 [Elysia marginata]|uniref:Uncharacterized protein n=1 Tax=Elysia marginata TaxID=1093978 RepID=A0AAV4HB65_9GAST|nr:hypothetical protein ElyMa_002665100 [Elysia marginata]